jgi:hypothetical protein
MNIRHCDLPSSLIRLPSALQMAHGLHVEFVDLMPSASHRLNSTWRFTAPVMSADGSWSSRPHEHPPPHRQPSVALVTASCNADLFMEC